ncbi:NIPSNAP family protein [Phragmitibacter flavus]|uniref:NIPSNAP family protein n=1 Tax=Phragmitibacter flavus TaxID=2576071 RepID=A0A5R8KI13_9BACT|nr:NIPSNAP family protein [Phragmitibacter flavus]TLD71880.1 NIPSNAP family protein [Phragmitibacter flavus]
MNFLSRLLLLATAMPLFTASALQASETSASATPVYELRIYTTNEGKLPNLLARFRDHTFGLFEKHGITNIGYWTPIEKEDGADTTLIYLLSHKSREAAKASYAAFGQDPAWKSALAASEVNGKILAKPPESIFLDITAYSPKIEITKSATPRVFELRTYTTTPGNLDNLHARFTNHTMKLFSKYGMSHLGYWTPSDADKGKDNTLIYLLFHNSKEAGLESFTNFRKDPDWIAAKGLSEKDGSLTIPQPDGVKSVYLKAVDFSPIE